MLQLVYISSATTLFSPEDLRDLLAVCRERNARAEVTGMLLYQGGNFIQLLEGPEETLMPLEAKIRRDPRHTGMLTLLKKQTDERLFEHWSMGFQNLDPLTPAERESFSPILNEPLDPAYFGENPAAALKLLLTFRRDMR